MELKLASIQTLPLTRSSIAQGQTQSTNTIGASTVVGPRRTLANNMTASLTTHFPSEGRFVLVEWDGLVQSLKERSLDESGTVSPIMAARIDQSTGAKVLVTGREFNAPGKAVTVMWIQPPSENKPLPARREPVKPSFYTVLEGKGAVVIVQAGLVSDLSESPQAQLNLIQFARLALRPEPLRLPDLTQQPSTNGEP